MLGGSVQAIEHLQWPAHRRWVVVRLLPGLRVDRCYPLRFFSTLMPARICALEYARHLVGGGDLDRFGCGEDWIASGPRGSSLVLVVRQS